MKRFTETDKWRDPWFRKLSPGAKLAFTYIVENCDNAGVWSGDKELADFSIGMAIPWDKVLADFSERITVLPGGEWLVNKFVQFQYGTLSESCKPHLQVLRLIESHRVSKGYPKGINTLEEKDKEKDKEKEGMQGEAFPTSLETCLAQIGAVGIDRTFAEYVYGDWSSREGKDGANVKTRWAAYVAKRWNREKDEWSAGCHKGQKKVSANGSTPIRCKV